MFGRPRRKSTKLHDRRLSNNRRLFHARLRVEALEDRRLLAMGDLLQTFTDPSTTPQDSWFGYAVAVDGHYAAVGAPEAASQGATYGGLVCVLNSDTGELVSILNNPAPSTGNVDVFGGAVAVSGNIVVVGAYQHGPVTAGEAYVFEATTGRLLSTLVNPTPASWDMFGAAVAVSGNTVVVGACWDDTGGTDSGSAYVFDATTGNLLFTLANPTRLINGAFGASVAVSGNTIVVGASGSGSAYVFDASTGYLLRTLVNPTPASGDAFGGSVAVSGSTVVVGASGDDTGATNSGSAYVFDATTGNLRRTLMNPTPATDDGFGTVTISGNTIIVGAPRDDTGATDSGSLYVFDATTGNRLRTIANPTPAANDNLGGAIAVSGNAVVVGARQDTNGTTVPGCAYVFDAATGELVRTLANSTPSAGDGFGSAVAISGNTLVIGAPDDDTGGTSSGAVRVYDATTGDLRHTLVNPPPTKNDRFGYAVAISDNTIIVGASQEDGWSSECGEAYVFDATTGSRLRTLPNPTPQFDDQFGSSVAVSGNTVVVGAYRDNTDATDSGSAYVFDAATGNLLYTLANPTPAANDRFGYAVAVAGNTIVVGAPGDYADSSKSGSVYVFDTATGNLLCKVKSPSPAYDNFGASVAVSDNMIVVGCNGVGLGGSASHFAYAFDAATGRLRSTFTSPSSEWDDKFGCSVAISGNAVLIGAYYDHTGAYSSGLAYVFDARTGDLLHTLANPNPSVYDCFGLSVAVSGQNAIVGTPGDNGLTVARGAAYLFHVDVPRYLPQSIAVGFGGSLGSWIWNSPGVWTPLHGATPIWMVSGDWDGNGKQDIVANFGGSTGIWVYHDTGVWEWLHGLSSNTATTADLNGDGRDELVMTCSTTGVAGVLAYYPASGKWQYLSGWQAESFAVGDFDGNGKQDVATDFGEGKGLWFWNNNTAWQYVHNVNPGWMVAGDLDGNGKTDLALSVTGTNNIWARLDSGAWQFIKSMANSTATAADANGDGRAELFVSITDPVFAGLWEYVLPASSWKYTTNWRPENLTSADVDGNGKKDIVADFGTNGLWIYKNDATWQCMHGFDAAVLAGASQPQQAPQAAMSASARGELLLAMLDEFTTDSLNAKRRTKL